MAFYSLIDCAELHDTVQEERSIDGWTASVVLECAWEDRHLLAEDILSFRREWPHTSYIFRPRARSCGITGDGSSATNSGQCMNYQKARVTVSYDARVEEPDDENPENIISESLEPSVEFITLDHTRFRWGAADGDPLLENEAPGKQLFTMSIRRRAFQLRSINFDYLNRIGAVNDAAYTSRLLGLTFPAETLLYVPPTFERNITVAGAEAWNANTQFIYRKGGWNRFWRAETEQEERIFDVEAGANFENYPLEDFSNILF